MQPDLKILLCSYQYDALNRLIASVPSAQAATQRFYLKDRLATETQGTVQHSFMQQNDHVLAQQHHQGNTAVWTSLLATDQQRSVLNVLDEHQPHPIAYTAYGHRPRANGLLSLLGFNGELSDPLTRHYLLGNGYRAFNSVLMRFNSPDSWSPFGKGGLNAYAYCVGDPVNRIDPTGHLPNLLKLAQRIFSRGHRNRNDSMTSLLISETLSTSTAAQTQADTVSGGILLEVRSKKDISAIKGRIPRNEAKLTNAKNELINLEQNPKLVIQKALDNDPGDFGPIIQEQMIRAHIPKRIERLNIKITHYETKLTTLKSERNLSDIRKGL